jgi:hypothetical protein
MPLATGLCFLKECTSKNAESPEAIVLNQSEALIFRPQQNAPISGGFVYVSPL